MVVRTALHPLVTELDCFVALPVQAIGECDIPPERAQEYGEILFGVRMARLYLDCALERVDRAFVVLLRQQHDAEVAVPVGLIRHTGQALSHERDRFVKAALLVRRHARVMESIGMVGNHLERPPAERVRVVGTTLFQALYGEGDRLVHREREGFGAHAHAHPILFV